MELSGLFESEADDYVARTSAALVHRQIAWWLQNNEDRISQRAVTSDDGGFLLFADQIDLDEDYPDLVVAFLPSSDKETTKGFGSRASFGLAKEDGHPMLRGKKMIILYCLKAPGDYGDIADRFRVGMKSPFIHEFQHYLMSSRRQGEVKTSSEALKQGGIAAYFNDNDETNAYYVEATHDIVDFFNTLRDRAPQKLQRYADKTTPELMAWAKEQFFFPPFLRHASPKTTRALNRRLYRFFEDGIRPMIARVLKNYE